MKALEFIYQDTQIHFLLQNEGEVMVNATEMAKLFSRKTTKFLKTDNTKAFIELLKRDPKGAQIIQDRGRNGIYFERILALKFAAWLDPEFEVWVYTKIDEVLFGNYKKHWDAHQVQEKAKNRMDVLKEQLLTGATTDLAVRYFEAENEYNTAGNMKRKALRDQMKFDFPE